MFKSIIKITIIFLSLLVISFYVIDTTNNAFVFSSGEVNDAEYWHREYARENTTKKMISYQDNPSSRLYSKEKEQHENTLESSANTLPSYRGRIVPVTEERTDYSYISQNCPVTQRNSFANSYLKSTNLFPDKSLFSSSFQNKSNSSYRSSFTSDNFYCAGSISYFSRQAVLFSGTANSDAPQGFPGIGTDSGQQQDLFPGISDGGIGTDDNIFEDDLIPNVGSGGIGTLPLPDGMLLLLVMSLLFVAYKYSNCMVGKLRKEIK